MCHEFAAPLLPVVFADAPSMDFSDLDDDVLMQDGEPNTSSSR